VSAQNIPKLFTVEEFEQIPDPSGGRYELHHGEVVFVTYPVRQHGDLQDQLQTMLFAAAQRLGYIVRIEYPYRPLPNNELWGADVACVLRSRHAGADKWLVGSPELVVEVKSPSNTKQDLDDKAMTTLAGEGAVEFWIVDGGPRTVKVYSKASGARIYRAPEKVPFPLLGCEISLDDLFAVLE
jgi:Uma2 family endonuclease